ncbi:MAG: L-histidine N(alpha)-methyltransferase [Nocardioidaceae bacterium]
MTITVDNHLPPDFLSQGLRADVLHGLTARQKSLPPKWIYDKAGSELFEEITRLPEYYPTRAERSILLAHADEMARLARADTLVELGSGSSEKTRLLLSAMRSAGALRRYVPVDVSESALLTAGEAVRAHYDGLAVHAVVADFEKHLERLPEGGRRLTAFLGSTIGNLEPAARAALLRQVRSGMAPGDTFLLGTDLVKDAGVLVRAYDDARGVTAAFNSNLLTVINRELGADFDLDAFGYVARWDPDREWVEMGQRAASDQTVTVRQLDLTVPFAAGEEMRTEIAAKFRRDGVTAELAAAGLDLAGWWTDEQERFAVSLSVPC